MIEKYQIIKGFADTSIEFLKVKISGDNFPVHYHKRHCEGMIESGSMLMSFKDRNCSLKENDFFTVPAFECHSCKIPEGQNAVYSVISFSSRDELISLKSNTGFMAIINQRGLMPLYNYACRSVVVNTYSENSKIKSIIRYIDDNYMNPLKIENMTAVADLSLSRLQHLFKKETGMSLKNYIIQERVRKSRNMVLLENPADIALDCGFYDQSHFNRNFKKYTGVSPLKYAGSIEMADGAQNYK